MYAAQGSFRVKNKGTFIEDALLESGDDLLSRAVSSQVPSALRGLTSVFGMGTGGTLLLLPPEIVFTFISFPENCTEFASVP